MSKVTEMEQKIEQEKRNIQKQRYLLEDEINQIEQDKFDYKRKGDYNALDKANLKQRELKHKFDTLKSGIPSLEAQLRAAKLEEKREQNRLERQRQQRQKEHETRSQMNSVLRVMRQGKTREQAAASLGIPLSRINHWYHEGVTGTNKNTSHFYRELKSIEEDRERRKREEINRQNRLKQEEYERKQRLEKERKERERQKRLKNQRKERERQKRLEKERKERERQERLEKERKEKERQKRLENQKLENRISQEMSTIISQMRRGKTRKEAANYAGVPISTVNEWYDKGWKRDGKIYRDFYDKVAAIEIWHRKEKKSSTPKKPQTTNTNMIACPHCGKKYNKLYLKCPHCNKYRTGGNETTKTKRKYTTSPSPYKTTSTAKSDSSDLEKCCMCIFIIFMIYAILSIL